MDENKVILQHNAITSGRYDYTATQLNLLFALLSSLKENELCYRFRISDLELITSRKINAHQLKEITRKMGDAIELKTNNGYIQKWLFNEIEYNNGVINFEINPKNKHYLLDLKSNFTAMQLQSVLMCTSKYAKRIYALCSQWKSIGKKEYSIDEVKEMLGIPNDEYLKPSHFKAKVLNISEQQINDNTDLEVELQLFKRYSRSYNYVRFNINQAKNKQVEIDFKEDLQTQKLIKIIESYGLTTTQATAIAKKYNENDFMKIIKELNKQVKEGKHSISNAPAYLVGVFRKKGVKI